MFRFLLLFSISILILTSFPVDFIFFGFLFVILALVSFYTFFHKPSSLFLIILQSIVPIVMATFAVSLFQYTASTTYQDIPAESSYLFSGTILQWLKDNEYIFETTYGHVLVRNVDEELFYWEKLLINWYFSPIDTSRQWWLFVKNLSIPGVFSWEFDYDMRLRTKWYIGDLYYTNSLPIIADTIETSASYIVWLRGLIKKRISALYTNAETESLLSWMLVWDISKMSKEQYFEFIDSNLVHLVAVSWGNIVILVVFLFYLLFFLPYRLRILCVVPCIFFYAFLVWFDASVFRATIMWLLTLTALISWRSPNILRLMGIVWVCILFFRPYSLVYDLWFLLSFSALWWIIFFQDLISPVLQKLPRALRWFAWNYIFSSVWASLWVLPILLFFIWSTNIVGFIANIFALPFVPLIMYGWIISLWIWHTYIWEMLIHGVEFLLSGIFVLSDFFANHWVYVTLLSPLSKYLFFVLLRILYIGIYRYVISSRKKIAI